MSEQKVIVPNELVNPASQAAINQLISSAVKEVFANMAPMLESIALTPAKMAEAEKLRRAPDPALVAREARERKLMREELEEVARQTAERQRNCSHKDANGHYCVSLCHNFPDRGTRALCHHCAKFFQPLHWEIGPPDEKHPRGKPILVNEDPQYGIVRELESMAT